jgi:iron complex outermembrane receptor protein
MRARFICTAAALACLGVNTARAEEKSVSSAAVAGAQKAVSSSSAVGAQKAVPSSTADAQSLPAIEVVAAPSAADKYQVPGTTESITAMQAKQTINVIDTEDALKYLPDVLVRKRYIGDTQAPIATRTTGINAGARSLVIVDGVLLSTLINNNNGNGSPQWFIVSPEEIDRIDVMTGPFSAAYAGNSYGAVTAITTRMPQKFEAGVDTNFASQSFGKYGTSDTFSAQQYSATLGDKVGKFSWFLSANHLDSESQPITFGTIAQSTTPAGATLPVVTGAYADRGRTGSSIQVIGASNFVHTIQDNATLKLAYDFSPALTASYMLGYWQNNSKASAKSYLSTAQGEPYYGAATGSVNLGGYAYSASTIAGQFAGNNAEQEHLMQSLTLAGHNGGAFDWEFIGSNFQYLQDLARTSTGVYPQVQDGGAGRVTDMSGTGWSALDLNGFWRPGGAAGAHSASFGVHYDTYKLASPTYSTTSWLSDTDGSLYSDARGNTATTALWLQDVWRIAPAVHATLGSRYEMWRAYDGFNFSSGNGAGFPIDQPGVHKNGLSPKASIRWDAGDQWSVTGSYGRALRFPTVGELYQSVQTGSTFTQANPFLKPENVQSAELALERDSDSGKLRLSLFQENVSNALISQTSFIDGVTAPVSFTQNVDKTRQRGIELAAQQDDVAIKGLQLSGNVTYVDARILANGSYVPTIAGATSVGKHTPYVPAWRATLAATYRPDDKWAFTVATRYSGRMYATVDNTDTNSDTFTGFDGFFLVDARVHYDFAKHWSAAIGVDNLTNRGYFLYHPFPQRTIYAELKYQL